MLYLLLFILVSIGSVSYYNGSVLGIKSGLLSLVCMILIAYGIYLFTDWLTQGHNLVTGLYMMLSPAAGLIVTIMLKSARVR
ncbi:DUF2545 family protein [Pseudocitrobacter cyperus]|uniref:DUF2545 family protein n=1 Tax=Pseudocitrobacter cyperus TaxID=3112843 RepID=A0ABV0HDQ9_9ENTR